MQPLPDMDDDRRMTVRCREYIEKQCLLKPNTHVAEDVGINEKVVRQIGQADADRRFEEQAKAALTQCPECLGLFAKDVMEWDHGPKGRRLICAPCNRFHTKEWFSHGSRPTPKSE